MRRKADPLDNPLSEGDGVSSSESAVAGKKPKPRFSVTLTEDGSRFDIGAMREAQRVKFMALLASEPSLTPKVSDALAVGPITPEHVEHFLSAMFFGARLVIPRLVSVRTQGKVNITPEIAAAVYRLTPEAKEKLTPKGAQHFNEVLPDKIKKWIAKTGPGAEFWGGASLMLYVQTLGAMQMANQMDAQNNEAEKSNGHAKTAPAESRFDSDLMAVPQ